MSDEPVCDQCGGSLGGNTAQGLCTRCLLGMGLALTPAAAPDASTPFDRIRYFGDYELLEEIARGGMGVVHRARQVSLNRIVAVKLILSGELASEAAIQRFHNEAKAAASLRHPHIVAIHEVGEHRGQQYFSMDYIQGGDLSQLVRPGPLPARAAAELIATIAGAVHYAHQHGVVHRDLKPSNILIDALGAPHITDFGLAKRLAGTRSTPSDSSSSKVTEAVEHVPTQEPPTDSERPPMQHSSTAGLNLREPFPVHGPEARPKLEVEATPDLTLTGQVLGSPSYMSPEQATGRSAAVGVPSDIYSLGGLLYFLLTGRPPFLAGTVAETIRAVQEESPVAPRQLDRSIPEDLETICLKCLEKEPARRYASAEQLSDELGRFLRGEPIHAHPVSRVEKAWRWCRRKPALAASFLALSLALLAGITGISWQWHRAGRNADAASQQSARAERHAASETAQRVRAEEAVTALELQRAEDLLEKDEVIMGVASLARLVRQQPTNRVAAQRLLSALTQRNFALPVGARLQHSGRAFYAEFSPDGRRVVTASADFTARVWDAQTGEPLTPPMLHPSGVRTARFSPDGERLLTFTDDFRAHLWEPATGRALGQPMAHAKKIHSAQFRSDGRRVLTASDDGTARVWDAHTGEPRLEPLTHQGPVLSAGFSPDGSQIVTASEDKTAQVWDALTGRPAAKPFRHRGVVEGAEFSPDGKWVVTVSKDLSTCVWDVASGEPRAKPLVHPAPIQATGFSPDGERIISLPYDNGPARVWRSRDWAPLARPMQHRGNIHCLEFGPEAQRLLTASIDNTAKLWDAESGESLSAPMQHDGLVRSARFSPDGLFAITASVDKTARLWDVRLGGVRSEPLRHAGVVVAAKFSPDGEWILTGSVDRTARIWKAHTCQPLDAVLRHAGWILDVTFTPDGRRIATGASDGTARIWDAATGRPLTDPLRHGASVDLVQFSPDGQTLATASWRNTNVVLWNAQTGEPRGEPIPHPGIVHVLSFSPDGRWLLLDDFRNNLGQIREVESHRLLMELRGHEGYLQYGEFSSDGQRVLTASEDGTARIWNAHTGQPLTGPLRHKGQVLRARFSHDALRVVTASDDSMAQVWDGRTGQPVGEPLRHRSEVNTAEFSPDDVLVVTASDDGTMRLWDASTGRPVSEPFEHHGKVVSARFSSDGRRVLTASHSGSARVWDVPPGFGVRPGSGALDRAVPDQRVAVAGSPADPESKAVLRPALQDAVAPSSVTLLADLAEAVICKRINAQGALESVSPAGLGEVRQRVSALPHDVDFTRWLEWFLADRSTRPISPYSPIAMPEYVWARAKETNEVAWREALMLSPHQGYAFAQFARHYLQQSKSSASAEAALADWNSRRAVSFASWDWWSWQQRVEVLEHTGAWTNLLTEAALQIQLHPTNHYAWDGKARAFAALRQYEAAVETFTRALKLGDEEGRFQSYPHLRRRILVDRSQALRQLGRIAEAVADNAARLRLAARDPQAGPHLIDLGLFYNGGGEEELPGTIQQLAGTDFDFRGWIHLDARRVWPWATNFPERVNGIPIDRPCRRLHFLQTASFASSLVTNASGVAEEHLKVPFGVAVGHYIIHYADGQEVDVPIRHGRDVRDYWHFAQSLTDDPALVVAWTGATTDSRRYQAVTRLYKQTWENPRPDVTISRLDFVESKTHAVPILVAITAE